MTNSPADRLPVIQSPSRRGSGVARDRTSATTAGYYGMAPPAQRFRAGVAEDAPRAKGRWVTGGNGKLRWLFDWQLR